MAAPIPFITVANVEKLFKLLTGLRDARREELARIGDVFGDPLQLARFYVEPECQHHNPADRHEDQEPVSQVQAPAFDVINKFLRGDFTPLGDGRTQMFILSDAWQVVGGRKLACTESGQTGHGACLIDGLG